MKRGFTLVLSAAIAALSTTATVAQEKATFVTNWFAQAEHGGFYQSVADGTYKACGVDVTVQQGGPQVNGRALMMAGKAEFFMGSNLLDLFNAVQENIPIKTVMATFQKEPQIMMTHPGQGMDTWEDMKKNGDKFIVSDGAIETFFKWMVTTGFDANKRDVYTFNSAPFLANKKAAQQGYLTSEPFAIEKEGGFQPNVFLIADNGFDTYSTTVEVMQDTIDKRPEVVKCFVEGSIKGWYNYLYGDNAAANDLIKKDNPDMTDEQIAYSVAKLKEHGIVDGLEAEELGIGAMSADKINAFYDKMVAAGVTPAGLDVSKGYLLDYVNKGLGKELKK
jgi:NitT/TauT family transport system substrate-binding protein